MNRIIIGWLVVFSLVVSLPLFGVEKDIAILVRGPVKTMGFPSLYPNAIETWSGYYRYWGLEVVVSFTREDILLPAEWESSSCEKLEGFSPEKNSFYYDTDDWSLLFKFQNSVGEPVEYFSTDNVRVPFVSTLPEDPCPFIDTFIIRLKYFLRDADPGNPPLLPAILEF